MALILIMLVVVIVAVLPVKIAASLVGAGRTGFGWCLMAVIVAVVIEAIAQSLVGDRVMGALASLLVTSFVYMLVLDTTFFKGLGIAVLQIVITIVAVLLLATLGLSISSTTLPTEIVAGTL